MVPFYEVKKGSCPGDVGFIGSAGHCYADWFGECESTDEDRRE